MSVPISARMAAAATSLMTGMVCIYALTAANLSTNVTP